MSAFHCGPRDLEGRASVDAGGRALRQAAIDRLAQLSEHGCLSSDHVRLTAQTLGVGERTVWRWLSAQKRETPAAQRDRFRIDL
ncbi:hypothetical protein ACLMAJ_31985 [Nocardia sp. KC 131]|uniref:hypothetical protein n=1 Tax=Nocardia arseniciresistens TaxID=3392119 RepID=UPI00398F18F5